MLAPNNKKTAPEQDFKYDFLVFIGRFQPFHKGHEFVIKSALTKARRVIVLLGSSKCARSVRNPFTWEERAEMITQAYSDDDKDRIVVTPLLDLPYDEDQWIKNVKLSAQGIVCQYQVNRKPVVGLIGHSKDQSSYYLNMFPDWGSENVSKTIDIDATVIREPYLETGEIINEELLPDSTIEFMKNFVGTEAHESLKEEFFYIKDYKAAWTQAPFPPTFITVDNLIVHNGKVLLIQRKAAPGKGLWALPGGFVDPHETLQAAAVRELTEETNILVPESVLRKSIVAQKTFDDPHRSARGRTITTVFHSDISLHEKQTPVVNAADDAAATKWVPIKELSPEEMFEDHYSIIRTMLG